MTIVTVDHATPYLEYPILDKIHRQPAREYLRYLKKQPKANVQTVISYLGLGQHGNLGLVLSQIDYYILSNKPYMSTLYPDPWQPLK